MTVWAIARPRHTGRASAYGGGATVTVWEPDPRYGAHATNLASWLAGEYQPGWSDAFAKLTFDRQRANIGLARVVRVASAKPIC